MKTNPILNFRNFQNDIVESKGNINNADLNTSGLQNQATMITKTREAIDSSEISMTHETMQDTFYIEHK